MNFKKLLTGFGLFLAYFIVARILENKVSLIGDLTQGKLPVAAATTTAAA